MLFIRSLIKWESKKVGGGSMSKYRIYELAKEFDTTSKVIIDILTRNNMPAKNHMSSVDDTAKALIDRTFARKTESHVKPAVGANAAPKAVKEPNGRNSQPTDRNTTMHSSAAAGQRPQNDANRNPAKRSDQQRGNYSGGGHSSSGYHRSSPTNQTQSGSGRQDGRVGASSGQNRPNRSGSTPNSAGFRNTSTTSQGSTMNQGNNRGTTGNRPNTGSRPNNNTGSRPANTNSRPSNTGSRPTTGNRPNTTANRPNSNGGNRNFGQNHGKNTNNHSGHGQNFNQNRNRPQNNRSQNNRHKKNQAPTAPKMEIPKPTHIQVGELVTVKDFAIKCHREVGEIIKKLMVLGVMATINQEIDFDTAVLLGGEFGVTVTELPPEADPTETPEIVDAPESLQPRSPVVTVMGHVDHGKTSLLDCIRKANVTASEAGGITQHIGAYQVNYQGKRIVFLDTPGHEAFTAMRARGAQVTDISILVVAADDGVMPQTIEAINHSKSAEVPIIVAINKMDRPGANPDRVKQQLAEQGLVPEDWGGDTIMVPVSAHQKTGITDLLEMILLVAEMQELKANPNRNAYGTIIEAQLDKGRGPVATVLVQKGTLRIGDSIIAGTAHGKVRAMVNDRGEKVKKAGPSTPVEVLGLSDVPEAGDILEAVEEKIARAVAEKRIAKKRTEDMQQTSKVSLDDLFKQIQEGNLKDLNIVVKADVQGSIEALKQALMNLKNDEVRVNVVHAGVGAINESDVMLASASNTLIIGFNVRPDANARKAAEAEKVDIRTYRVIYDAINDVQAAITGMLAPTFKETILGRVEVRKVFHIPQGTVAGSYVLEGKITNKSQVRIIRDDIVIHEGVVEGLRRFKDDAKEVAAGYECGVSIEKFRDIKEGDILEAFIMEEIKPAVQP